MTKKYELVFILQPDYTENEASAVAEKIKKSLEDLGAKIEFEDIWGKRKLAYKIAKCSEGYYFLYEFEIESQKIKEVDNELNLHKDVIRHLVVILPAEYQRKTLEQFSEEMPKKIREDKREDKKAVPPKKIVKKAPVKKAVSEDDDNDDISKDDLDEKLDKILSADFNV